MAQRTYVIKTDDLDGGEAAETVTFSIDGRTYEIDLSEKNADKLRDALAEYVRGGRRLKGTAAAAATRQRGHAGPNPETRKVREWAQQHGYEVSERGRVPQEVWEAYRKG